MPKIKLVSEGMRSLILSFLVSIVLAGPVTAQQTDSLMILIQEFKYTEALSLIDSLEQRTSEFDFVLQKAQLNKSLNRFSEAKDFYLQLYRRDTSNMNFLAELASCYYSLGDYTGARHYYGQALQLDPLNNYILQRMADAWFNEDNFARALQYYMAAMGEDTTYYLCKQTGRCFENLENKDSAVFWYNLALDLTRIDLQTSYRLASLYKDEKDYTSALKVTSSYIELDSLNLRMNKLQGYLFFLNEEFDKAVRTFEYCVKLNDISEFTNKYLGFSYFKTEAYDSAKSYLEKAFLVDSTNAELCYILGLACSRSYYREQGIACLGKTLELVTPSPEFLSRIYQDRAEANTGFYRYEAGLNDYLKALELTPSDTLLLFKIASQYDNWMDDSDKALEYYTLFYNTRPEDKRNTQGRVLSGEIFISYYDYAERRIGELREKKFWEGK